MNDLIFTKKGKHIFKTNYENFGCLPFALAFPLIGVVLLWAKSVQIPTAEDGLKIVAVALLVIMLMAYAITWVEGKLNKVIVTIEELKIYEVKYNFENDYFTRDKSERVRLQLPSKDVYLKPSQFNELRDFLAAEKIKLAESN